MTHPNTSTIPVQATGPAPTLTQPKVSRASSCPSTPRDSVGLDLIGNIGLLAFFVFGLWFYCEGIRSLSPFAQIAAWAAPSVAIAFSFGCAWLFHWQRTRQGRNAPGILSDLVVLIAFAGFLCNLVPVLIGFFHTINLGEVLNLGWLSLPIEFIAGAAYLLVTGLGQFVLIYVITHFAKGDRL